jgi:hypothetical protein
MEPKTLLEILAEDDGSLEAVLKEIAELRQELLEGRTEDWENPTLESFLDAMHAWLESTPPQINKPSWRFVQEMLGAAKIYE